MPSSILITQCLQNDFVKPIGRYEPLPNLLHIGFDEARRLVGEIAAEGPVSRMMAWAHGQSESALQIIHIRDWHDPNDTAQLAHLRRFGSHCLRETEGAEFVFGVPPERKHSILVDSLSLNDFHQTSLEEHLRPFAEKRIRVGLIGVWTEAKIAFLAYELTTRYPAFEVGLCSALTASSSRAQHFLSLAQIKKILDVQVFASVGEFISFLGGSAEEIPLAEPEGDFPAITFSDSVTLHDPDLRLLRYLFRGSRTVNARILDGGFSGNVVLGTESTDFHGHKEVSHVIKIGEAENVGRERASFEQIESVLGNAAPRIVDFADYGTRGALKYRYASMGGGFSTTFQKLYTAGMEAEETERILRMVFEEQLGRLYGAATFESCNLLEHYWFSSRWAPNVRQRVESLLGSPAAGETIEPAPGERAANLSLFYERELDHLLPLAQDSVYMSFVHGDLNGANIIVDGRKNVWIIDYFHTGRAHVLKDLIKLENDLLFIFTPIMNETEIHEACRLTDHLLSATDLGVPLPPLPAGEVRNTQLRRAFDTVNVLRSFYPPLIHSDRDPLQAVVGRLRYAVHTLSFDESNGWQKRWALYTACRCAEIVRSSLRRSNRLRIDWLDAPLLARGSLGITILPGRRDLGRSLEEDLDVLGAEGVTHVVPLVPHDELEKYGVGNLHKEYTARALTVIDLPIPDQGVPSEADMRATLGRIREALRGGGKVLVHCAGGLGRSGTVAAALLKTDGMSTEEAIAAVRRARGERAIETNAQLEFLQGYIP